MNVVRIYVGAVCLRNQREKGLVEALKPITLYIGFDQLPFCICVGNLVVLLVLRRFQLAGHKCLVGGATGLVGDPSGMKELTQ